MSEHPKTTPVFLDVKELADLLKVKPRTVYAWSENEKKSGIPVERAGNLLRFRLDRILEWTAKQ